MGYKKLANFIPIINRPDFTHIATNTEVIRRILRYTLNNPGSGDAGAKTALEKYSTHLYSVLTWLGTDSIPLLRKTQAELSALMTQSLRLLDEPEEKRSTISRSTTRTFTKHFETHLNNLLTGIRASFDPDIRSTTKILPKQLITYLLDATEGLGTKFAFNSKGPYSPTRHLIDLTFAELGTAHRLLTQFGKSSLRQSRLGWLDLGSGSQNVRILIRPSHLRRPRVYYIFRTSGEHAQYEKILNTVAPEKADFSAA